MAPFRVPSPTLPSWLKERLEVLSREAPLAGIAGWSYYAPWFAGRFGPLVVPPETEVIAPEGIAASDLRTRLEAALPSVRWRLRCVRSGRPVAETALVAGRGVLRLEGGLATYVLENEAVARHLRRGLLAARSAGAAEADDEAERLLALFPGLRAPFLGYEGKPVESEYARIQRQVEAGENGGRRKSYDLSGAEREAAASIAAWHRHARRDIEAVELPGRAALPDDDPWTAPDAQYREWLLSQTLLSVVTQARDAFLMGALAAQRGEQKPTHQGWETYEHAIVASLLLETDAQPGDRRALRVAMLLHDLGKVHNVWTPGAHPLIGAKQWRRLRPEWLTNAEADLVTFLIRTHDLLGRLDRTLQSPDFRGALSPTELRQELLRSGRLLEDALRLHTAIYEADIGSLPTLRWLLPLTPLLHDLVLAAPRSAALADGQVRAVVPA